MAQPKSSDNVVEFPRSDSDSGPDHAASASPDPQDVSPDFGPLGADWPRLSPSERAARLLQNRVRGDRTVPIGELLQAVRQAHGHSVEDIAAQLKFDRTIITAIETMDIGAMPRGFRAPRIRTYARALHLPADDVLAIYREESADLDAAVSRAEISPSRNAPSPLRQSRLAMTASIAAGALLCLAAAFLVGGRDAAPGAPTMASGETAPRTELPPFDSAAAAMQGDYTAIPLTLVAVREGWIEVRGANGTLFRDREMRPGEIYYPRIGAGWTVSARDGGAFEWRVGNVVVGPLGSDETSVYAESVDLVARKALKSVAPTLAASDAISPRH